MTWALIAAPTAGLLKFVARIELVPDFVLLQLPRLRVKPREIGLVKSLWRLLLGFQQWTLFFGIKSVLWRRCQVTWTADINKDASVVEILRGSTSDYCFVRGGKILSPRVLGFFSGQWINIHGGVLPHYRGLDSHLWAASRRDWESIGVTAHFLTEKLDQGPIIQVELLEDAQSKGWLALTTDIGKLINRVHSDLVNNPSISEAPESEPVSRGEYFGKFPRVLGILPRLKKVGH